MCCRRWVGYELQVVKEFCCRQCILDNALGIPLLDEGGCGEMVKGVPGRLRVLYIRQSDEMGNASLVSLNSGWGPGLK